MTLRSLEKFIQSQEQDEEQEQQQQDDPKLRELIQKSRGLQFYKWNDYSPSLNRSGSSKYITKEKHDTTQFISYSKPTPGDRWSCCWNHLVPGLPTKNGVIHPLYDYEKILFRALEIPSYLNAGTVSRNKIDKNKVVEKTAIEPLYPQKVGRLAVLKSTGIGATEFFIRWICWKCMVNDDLKGSDVCIITGPREQLSIDILDRIRKLFLPHGITFDTNKQTLFINGVRIRSYPSNRLQDMRGLPNVSIIYCDEAGFF